MFRLIDSSNLIVYFNLTQAYGAEFSELTQEVPDETGLFKGTDYLLMPSI